ncbi:hypothetical protein L596_008646 [Steinernema carpocapsae]|uniref:Uncharacterized protein n=1 Tax=Steinernema carpocapsae TaxID=34508 RepID=A0A4U5PDM2_STECR|nr:hypothetical protein L596_008646 [Steinernema carpocapsae]
MFDFFIFATFLLVFIFVPFAVISCSKPKQNPSPQSQSAPEDFAQPSMTDVDLYNAPLDNPAVSRSYRSVKPRQVSKNESCPSDPSPMNASVDSFSMTKSGKGSDSQRTKKNRFQVSEVFGGFYKPLLARHPEKVNLVPAPARDREEDKKRAKFAFLRQLFKLDGDKKRKEAERKEKEEEIARIAAEMKTLDDEPVGVEPKTGMMPSSDETQTQSTAQINTAQAAPTTTVVSAISASNREPRTKPMGGR